VQMAKKQKSMNAPTQARRASTTGLSRVTLPEMPTMPTMVSMDKMSSMTGGVPGLGTVGLGARGGGGPIPFFGLREPNAGALEGTFYDLKQTQDRKPTGMTKQLYAKELTAFINSGWNPNQFSRFYKGNQKLYATQIFTPDMDANKGPKAFDMEKEVAPMLWIVHYKGTVSPPKGCTFHFVGHGDDILMVRFNNNLVLNANWTSATFYAYLGYVDVDWKPWKEYRYEWPSKDPKCPAFRVSGPISVQAGFSYPIEILIGEQPGGRGHADLLIQVDGVTYKKDAIGNPILPIFRLAESKLPPLEKGETLPLFEKDGPVWKGSHPKSFGGSLDIFKK